MIRTPFCDLVGIDAPIVHASFGPWSSVALAAAVSRAGALGSYGTSQRPYDVVRGDVARLREEADGRSFAVNYVLRPLSEETVELTLEFEPPVVSFALGLSGELISRAQDAGAKVIQQVHTVEQARRAAEAGADAIIAQGSEAGGFGGTVTSLVLLPQVVDAVAPLPVLAAGGIADGRGLAAALLLGGQGANIGTRFLASTEAEVSEDWKAAILAARSEDAVKVEFAASVFPPPSDGGYDTTPRVLQTDFVAEWNRRPEEAARRGDELRAELMQALLAGRAHELVPFTGQSAGMIRQVKPAAEIVRELMDGAEQALRASSGLTG
jgi:nitronate monooxygenase/enoyl-[acyl-carrier protein] reductase II